MAEIVTTGTGKVERIADRAQLTVAFEASATTRAEAVGGLNTRLADVEQLVQAVGVRVASRQLSVNERWERRRRVGSVARQQYVLVFRDLAQLPDLVGKLAAIEPATLDGPHWLLAETTDARREAQAAAVTDARIIAEGYAAAVGAQLGPLLKLTDEQTHHAMMAAYGGAPAVDVSNLSLEPELVAVTATCVTTWQLL
ncbi:SIMPL domain-containing protein [Fodinicola acaciae]|uniref:SIMPL domain-containing protein n=1 Tax=Fodinicola acaciae TaxID=2681555 RepID=UPI0013D65FF9|nr:SIMPL domain-containing protein [Fodinicola acaciae]